MANKVAFSYKTLDGQTYSGTIEGGTKAEFLQFVQNEIDASKGALKVEDLDLSTTDRSKLRQAKVLAEVCAHCGK